MSPLWLAPYLLLWLALMRGLLVRARLLPPICRRCGLKLERRRLGEQICACAEPTPSR